MTSQRRELYCLSSLLAGALVVAGAAGLALVFDETGQRSVFSATENALGPLGRLRTGRRRCSLSMGAPSDFRRDRGARRDILAHEEELAIRRHKGTSTRFPRRRSYRRLHSLRHPNACLAVKVIGFK